MIDVRDVHGDDVPGSAWRWQRRVAFCKTPREPVLGLHSGAVCLLRCPGCGRSCQWVRVESSGHAMALFPLRIQHSRPCPSGPRKTHGKPRGKCGKEHRVTRPSVVCPPKLRRGLQPCFFRAQRGSFTGFSAPAGRIHLRWSRGIRNALLSKWDARVRWAAVYTQLTSFSVPRHSRDGWVNLPRTPSLISTAWQLCPVLTSHSSTVSSPGLVSRLNLLTLPGGIPRCRLLPWDLCFQLVGREPRRGRARAT